MQHVALSVLVVGALCLSSTPAWSDKGHKDKHGEGRVADLAKDAKVPIDQAIKTALEQAPGTPVEAELEKKHDKAVWEVEVLGADGQLTEVHIDAVSGAVIDTKATHQSRNKKDKH